MTEAPITQAALTVSTFLHIKRGFVASHQKPEKEQEVEAPPPPLPSPPTHQPYRFSSMWPSRTSVFLGKHISMAWEMSRTQADEFCVSSLASKHQPTLCPLSGGAGYKQQCYYLPFDTHYKTNMNYPKPGCRLFYYIEFLHTLTNPNIFFAKPSVSPSPIFFSPSNTNTEVKRVK